MMELEDIHVRDVIADPRCQPRAEIDPELVQEYADAMAGGVKLPPLMVYRSGNEYWLADGFHRLAAAKRVGRTHVSCTSQQGTVRDAILHAVGANADHGKRRTNIDKRRAVETLLSDPEWRQWSDHEIARRCTVSQPFVSDRRNSLITLISDTPAERTYTDRYGKVQTMNIENIGRRPATVPGRDTDDDIEIDAEEVDPSDPETYIVSRETGEVLERTNGNQRTKEDAEQTERMAIDMIERRIQGPDGDEVRRTALVAQYSTVVYTVMGKLVPLDPDVTARAIGDRQGTDRFIEQTRDWLDRFETARKRTGTIHELRRKDMTS